MASLTLSHKSNHKLCPTYKSVHKLKAKSESRIVSMKNGRRRYFEKKKPRVGVAGKDELLNGYPNKMET